MYLALILNAYVKWWMKVHVLWYILCNCTSSILGIISYQLSGVTLVGANVCGTGNNLKKPSEELCVRWYQLGAFYPLLSSQDNVDPGVWSNDAQNIIRSALKLRYSLLPYIYTLFYHSHLRGRPVVMPLSFQ